MSATYFLCPYCNKEDYIELENQNQMDTYKAECSYCHKTFTYTIVISADIIPEVLK